MDYLKQEIYSLAGREIVIFDFIQEYGLNGFWFWDLQNPAHKWINPGFYNSLGYSAAESTMLEDGLETIGFSKDIKDLFENALLHFQSSDAVFTKSIFFNHKNGQVLKMVCRIKCSVRRKRPRRTIKV
jgi:hypothetical protein